jgi:hypothetical protein
MHRKIKFFEETVGRIRKLNVTSGSAHNVYMHSL